MIYALNIRQLTLKLHCFGQKLKNQDAVLKSANQKAIECI